MGERNGSSAVGNLRFETGSVKTLCPKRPGDFAHLACMELSGVGGLAGLLQENFG